MILAEPNFLVCLVFPLISLAVTYLLDTALCYLRFTELIRRKTFHFMPLLILPYLHCLNPQLLVVALSVGFHLLLSVEMMRFLSGSKSKRRNYFINEVHSPHSFRWL